MKKVDSFELAGQTISKGDQISVLPSAPRHRNGFVAKVLAGITDDDGALIYVEVFGAPHHKAPGVRTMRLERVRPVKSLPRRRPRASKGAAT